MYRYCRSARRRKKRRIQCRAKTLQIEIGSRAQLQKTDLNKHNNRRPQRADTYSRQ
jgi:hypothetical protein